MLDRYGFKDMKYIRKIQDDFLKNLPVKDSSLGTVRRLLERQDAFRDGYSMARTTGIEFINKLERRELPKIPKILTKKETVGKTVNRELSQRNIKLTREVQRLKDRVTRLEFVLGNINNITRDELKEI